MVEDKTAEVIEAEKDAGEASRYWDEAVSVRVDGKEPPVEGGDKQEEISLSESAAETPSDTEPSSGDSGEESAAGEGEEATEDAANEVEKEETQEDDPWDGVPEELRKEYEETLEKAKKYEHSARSNSGRLGALQKKIDELTRKLEERSTPAQEAKAEPPVNPGDSIFENESWKKFKEDFGEVAIPIEDAIRLSYKDLHSRLQDTDKVSKTLQEARNQESWAEQARILEEAHPGWRTLVQEHSDEFNDFVSESSHRQELLKPNADYITDAAAGIDLFNLFKQRLSKLNGKDEAENTPMKQPKPRELTQKRQQQLKSAATVAPRSAPGPGRRSDDLPDPDDLTAAWHYFAEKAAR